MRENPFKIKENSVHDRSIQGYNAGRTVGDNLLFLSDFPGWLGKNLKGRHLAYFYLLLLLIFFVLIARIIALQVAQGSKYFAIAENNRTKIVRLKAPRGIIYDRYKRPLVKNSSHFTIDVNPQLIQNDPQALELTRYLTQLLPHSTSTFDGLAQTYKNRSDQIRIADEVPYEIAQQIIIKSSKIAAIQVAYEPRRTYLYDYGLGGVLGYIAKISPDELNINKSYSLNDYIGKNGLEKQYESLLRGTDGFINYEVDALGREKGELARTDPSKGSDITTTIDLDIQKKLYESLRDVSMQNNNLPAAGVALDPATGEILALVSYPSFDPNIFNNPVSPDDYRQLSEDDRKPLFMRAIAGTYPAGSVFKMVLAAGALQDNIITESFTVNSTGGVWLGDRFFPDWKAGGHGITNVSKAISDSVNTFFYIVGGGGDSLSGLGVDRIDTYATQFGFGQKTNIDLPSEADGFIPTRSWKEENNEKWYQGDTYNLSIGQGSLLVTPLQVARYTSLFANGEDFVLPHLLKSYDLNHTDTPYNAKLQPNTFINSSYVTTIRNALRRTVVSGTAQGMQSVNAAVAGKTGTAQFNNNKEPHSWFTGFAPLSKPEVQITAIVEEGGNRNLATVAARDFLEWYFSR